MYRMLFVVCVYVLYVFCVGGLVTERAVDGGISIWGGPKNPEMRKR